MQPLWELLRGRNLRDYGKTKASPHYEDYSGQSGSMQPGVEMRNKRRKKYDEYGLTVIEPDESQEQIVSPEDQDAARNPSCQSSHAASAGIMRTAVVTVTYDNGENGPTSATKRWAPV